MLSFWRAGVVATFVLACGVVSAHQPPKAGPPAAGDVDAKKAIAAALAAAKAHGRHVLLVFGADWCKECRILDQIFAAPDIGTLLHENFALVKIDVGGPVSLNHTDKNIDLTVKYGAFTTPASIAIPFVVVLDANGAVLDRTNKGEWKHARALTPVTVADALKRWAPKRQPAIPVTRWCC